MTLLIGASDLQVLRFNAEISADNPSQIELKWATKDENAFQGFVVKRKMSYEVNFQEISLVSPTTGQMSGSEKHYIFIDKNVYKSTAESEPVVYALYIKQTNGQLVMAAQADVNITTTAVRRTWGSIKAMFQ